MMSTMSELNIQILELYDEGFGLGEIADMVNCPLYLVDQVVNEYLDECHQDYDDPMDGDEGSALASAGWGTDEDYGSYDNDSDW
jgi:hypothetical protein